jgi:hypothetical protein
MNCHLIRILFLSVLLSLRVIPMYGQQIGIHGGLSLPDLRGKDGVEQTGLSRQDDYYGFFLSFKITNLLYFQTELNYCGEGGISSGIQPVQVNSIKNYRSRDTLYANYQSTTVLHYLEVPFLARMEWGQHIKYFLDFGIFAGYLLDAHVVNKGSGGIFLDPAGKSQAFVQPGAGLFSPSLLNSSSNIYSQVNTYNFGITGGGGMSYIIGRNQFFLDLRITEGMQPVYRDTDQSGKYKTGNVNLSLGYAFSLRK